MPCYVRLSTFKFLFGKRMPAIKIFLEKPKKILTVLGRQYILNTDLVSILEKREVKKSGDAVEKGCEKTG